MKNIVAVVTGAGRGIGREIAATFAGKGAYVALVSRTVSQLEDTASQIAAAGGKSFVAAADVTDEPAVDAAIHEIESELGPVNILVNNAGSFRAAGLVAETDPGTWWQDMKTNLFGVFLCCRAVVGGMMERRKGRIINLIGGGTASPFPYGSAYGSSKAGVMRFTESLAREVQEYGIAVFALSPGLVRTSMPSGLLETEAGKRWFSRIQTRFDEGKDTPPAEAARVAAALASGDYDELTGRAFGVRDDMQEVLARKEQIIRDDLHTLRMKE